MPETLVGFERIVRRSRQFTDARAVPSGGLHPFEERNIHPRLPVVVRELFDDGHFAQATFEAYKYLDKEVQRHSLLSETGFKLAMAAFSETSPPIKLTALSNTSEVDEQRGYRFIFAGTMLAIRNPRGHEYSVVDSPDKCLDHLNLASILLRRLEEAGYRWSMTGRLTKGKPSGTDGAGGGLGWPAVAWRHLASRIPQPCAVRDGDHC